MSETSSSSGISEHREDSPQDNELSSNLVQGEESSNTAATQGSQISAPPSSAPSTPLVTSEGPDQSQEPEDASEEQLLWDPLASTSLDEKPVRSVEEASTNKPLNMTCSSPRGCMPNSGGAKQNDYESKTSSTLGTRSPSPSRGAESRMNEQPSTAKQRRKSPVSEKSPEHTFVMAMPRKGRPTDKDGRGHIYAFTSPKLAPGCVKIGCKEGDIFDAYSRIDQQKSCYEQCEPMAVLATKYHKNAERLAHHILKWKDGPTEETRVTCLGRDESHIEWFRWRQDTLSPQKKEMEPEERFSQLWHNHALPAMLWAVKVADSGKDRSRLEEQVKGMIKSIGEVIKKQKEREKERERGSRKQRAI